jgi:hypothetical protein
MKDFYYILGTASNSTREQIDEAYRKLTQKFAPGSFEDDDFLQSHFKEITEAYAILSDPERRKKYDHALRRGYLQRARYFKISYLNIAVTLALLIFTGLFGWYVMRTINGRDAPVVSPKIVQVADPVSAPKVVKHHRHRHHHINIIPAPVYAAKATPVDTSALNMPKPAAAATKKRPAAAPAQVPLVDPGYMAYIKADISGQVYMHKRPDYLSEVLSVLPHHAPVRIVDKDKSFFKVVYNGQTGYVPRSTIE